MEKDNVCVFCGQKPGTFRGTTVLCGNTWQFACKACEKELRELDDVEKCRRALVRGLAEHPEKLKAQIELTAGAEEHRPKCVQCGTGLRFLPVQDLDNSPMRDSIFKEPFSVLPACCPGCGRYDFYNPDIARRNRYLAHLIEKDTRD